MILKDNAIKKTAGRGTRLEPVVLLCAFGFTLLVTFLVRHHVFFWDTVQLGSKHAHFYYDNHFASLLLPESIDSGHPPTFGLYLAAVWFVFGKSLAVSHFAMLPFLWGIVFFLWKIDKVMLGEQRVPWLLMLAIADPTLAAQSILVSPDVVLVCFFLMGVWSILQNKPWLKALAMLGLAMISMRGMMTVAALFLFEMAIHITNWRNIIKLLLQKIPFYLPAGLFGLAFLIWHYSETGWIGYHPDSPWAPSFAKVGRSDLLKNIIILAWRLLDFGRIIIWLVLMVLLLPGKNYRQLWQDPFIRPYFMLLLSCLFLLTPTLLLYQSLSAHRYLLPIYLALTLLVFKLLFANGFTRRANWLAGLILLGLLSGNAWIYPDKIAQGWDATLAHLPYYRLRTEILTYLREQNIAIDSIGTAFPEIGPLKFRDLSDNEAGFPEKDLRTQPYVLYSNVMNDFSDTEIDQLQKEWQPVKIFSRRGVRMILYKR